ncbi:helix-turn-helix transcriptional regulator [Lentilactobacillus diolivorans]|uniref:HTH cro/C1-type domain-containing protein n=2 Tax=Lentilactobacillus diolivorans TaxID=179838 RepID=A0A0R1SCR0_9LACO|nr:helix-turn-helix transcriptional regulator [Lentilactobacillus diolivorans]KRL64394.1 hypothetical protein FC85_GL000904 [Lentilactobacillus diolivorans DSM 14421]MDH5104919.1 helix-turn-helix transcriptional regulator [Lentilactobacillus diolivorans]GEP23111.1 hypothetical protein LDI01_07040 [Lentilactobacillus diolivorans]
MGQKIDLGLIRTIRRKKKVSQFEMAHVIGLKYGNAYGKYENGKYPFKAEQLFKLSEKLEIPLEKLFIKDSSKIEQKQ